MIEFKENELILITGASSGIGRATALLCNKLGARVIAVGRNIENLNSLKEEAEFSENIYLEPKDLAENLEALVPWVTELKKKYGKFSGFVHCAGYNITAPFKVFNYEDSTQLLDIHYHAAMLLTCGVTDRRNYNKKCSCVFISTISAVNPVKALSSYAAVKGAVQTAVRNISKELSTQNVRVNCVSPALVRTPMTEVYSNSIMGFDTLEASDKIYPLGVIDPLDVAQCIVFLLSDTSRKITGQNIVIEAGGF